jgi:REP element-mobilizing transposase RayT
MGLMNHLRVGMRRMGYDARVHHRRSIRLAGYDYRSAGAYFVTLVCQGRACLFGEIRNGVVILSPYGQIVAETWAWLAQQYPYVELDQSMVMPNHFHGILWIHNGVGARRDTCPGVVYRGAPRPYDTQNDDIHLTTICTPVGHDRGNDNMQPGLPDTPGTGNNQPDFGTPYSYHEYGDDDGNDVPQPGLADGRGARPGKQHRDRCRDAPLRDKSESANIKPLGGLIGAFKTVSTKLINRARGTPGVAVWQRNYYEHILRDDRELDSARAYIANNPLQWELDRENPLNKGNL